MSNLDLRLDELHTVGDKAIVAAPRNQEERGRMLRQITSIAKKTPAGRFKKFVVRRTRQGIEVVLTNAV